MGLFAISLIYFALTPGLGLLELLKFSALSIGITILFLLLYPRLKQVRKGDEVVIASAGPFAALLGLTARAMSDAAIGGEVRVKVGRGREAVGTVESYEGLFSPAKIRLIYEEVREE